MPRKMVHLSDIPAKLHQLHHMDAEWDSDRIHYDPSFNWSKDTKEEYEKVEAHLKRFKIKRKYFTVIAWCDISGYEYWTNDRSEDNYIQITALFTGANPVPASTIKTLANCFDKAYDTFIHYSL